MDESPDSAKASKNYLFGSRALEVLIVMGGFFLVLGGAAFFLRQHIFPVAASMAVLFCAYEDYKGMPGGGAFYLYCS